MQRCLAKAFALILGAQTKRQADLEGWRQQKRRQGARCGRNAAEGVAGKMTNVMRHKNPGGPCGRQGW